jgi:hypothetical protein
MKSKIWYHRYVEKLFLEGKDLLTFHMVWIVGWELCFDGRIKAKHCCP